MTTTQQPPRQKVFKFFDPSLGAFVYADPDESNRRLWFTVGNPQTLVDKVNSTYARLHEASHEEVLAADKAAKTLAEAVRLAFDLKSVDRATGQGATDDYCHQLYKDFCLFLTQMDASPSVSPSAGNPSS